MEQIANLKNMQLCCVKFAGRAIQLHSLVRFTVISHTPVRSGYIIIVGNNQP